MSGAPKKSLLSAAALCLALAGPARAEPGVTAEAITMGMEGEMKSFSGDEENFGFQLAFREANGQGGVHGRRIEWRSLPRAGGAAIDQALANAKLLVEQESVFALVNWGGPVVIKLSDYAAERKVPYLFPHSALVDSTGKRYLFTSFPTYAGEARLMFRYLPEQRGLRRIGIVHDENVYGQNFRKWFEEYAGRNGYTVAGNAAVATRDPKDLTAELKGLQDKGADAVVMALYPAQAKVLMQAKATLGFSGRMVSVGPLTDEEYLVLPGGAAEGTLGFCYYPDPNSDRSPGILAYQAVMRRLAGDKPMNRYSLYGYVFGRLILEGLRRAGPGVTRESFIDAMETIRDWDPQGVMPPVSFSATNHHAQFAGFLCELKSGRFEALGSWVTPQ